MTTPPGPHFKLPRPLFSAKGGSVFGGKEGVRGSLSLARETEALLKKLGARPLKKLGQHFMIDPQALSAIGAAVSREPESAAVVEIGPGLGFLTRLLLEKGPVTAIETDRLFARHLKESFIDKPLTVIQADVLAVDLQSLRLPAPIVLVGNIPYNITSPILEWTIRQRKLLSEALFTVQWEVAQRLDASPGSKAWGPLSVFARFFSDVEIVRKIGKGAFLPPPKVDSALIRLRFPKKKLIEVKDEKLFFSIVRRAFQKRRKTLLNSLEEEGLGLNKGRLQILLKELSIDPKRRPETLLMEEWAHLADLVHIS